MNSVFAVIFLASTTVTQSDLPIGERMLIGLETSFIGLLTVFAVLVLIWGVLELFKKAFSGRTGERKTKRFGYAKPPAPVPERSGTDDAALAAAITAAVAAYTNKNESSLRVVRFTRK